MSGASSSYAEAHRIGVHFAHSLTEQNAQSLLLKASAVKTCSSFVFDVGTERTLGKSHI
jgi:hypothetical protein